MDNEAIITINGTLLHSSEAMTIRIALEAYYTELEPEDALGDDEHGRFMRAAYRKRIQNMRKLFIPR